MSRKVLNSNKILDDRKTRFVENVHATINYDATDM
jgi:hypothetical protein